MNKVALSETPAQPTGPPSARPSQKRSWGLGSLTVRLALRDLHAQRGRTITFTLLIAIVLGLLTPLLLAPHLSTITTYARSLISEGPAYAASSTPSQQFVGSVMASGDDAFEATRLMDRLVLPNSSVTALQSTPVSFGNPTVDEVATLVPSDSPIFDHAITLVAGTVPTSADEVAIDLGASEGIKNSFQAFPLPALGDQVLLGSSPTSSATVVGYFQNSLPNSVGFGSFLSVANTPVSPSQANMLLFFASEQPSLQDVKPIAAQLEALGLRTSFATATQSPDDAMEFVQHILNQPDFSGHSAQDAQFLISVLALLAALLFVVLFGFPLFTLMFQRRFDELVALRRTGASAGTILSTVLFSALSIAAVAATLGTIIALALTAVAFRQFPPSQILTGSVISTILLLCMLGGFGSALLAAVGPSLKVLRRLESANNPFDLISPAADASQRSRAALRLLAAGVILLATAALFPPQIIPSISFTVLGIGGLCLLAGTYLLIPRVFRVIVRSTQQSGLALRIAARELLATPAFTTHAVIPITYVVAAMIATSVVFRQHYLEGYDGATNAAYAMVFPMLWLPLGCALLVICLTIGSILMGLTQVQTSRILLLDMGQEKRTTHRIEGYRALLITSVGVLLGLANGMFIGAIVVLFRFTSRSATYLPQAGALWAWETYLIFLVIPPLLAFLAGSVIGARSNTALSTQSQYQLV